MPKKNRIYTEDFQRDAIKLALKSDSISGTAKSLGIPEATLHTWVRNASKQSNNETQEDKKIIDLTKELTLLRKENARLREEKEILKKAAAYFAQETK